MLDTINDAQEHPIIFNDWSIRRILAGEKTQTRRIVETQPDGPVKTAEQAKDGSWYWVPLHGTAQTAPGEAFRCPYGQPGDVLWVREAFRLPLSHEKFSPNEWLDFSPARNRKYVADGKHQYRISPIADSEDCWGSKRPSIHMPRELCRLRLRVEDVRVERVQEISYEDVVAEGLEAHVDRERYGQKRTVKYPWSLMERDDLADTGHSVQDYDYAFKKLWNHIHGDGAWECNDWVWVIAFSRIDNNQS